MCTELRKGMTYFLSCAFSARPIIFEGKRYRGYFRDRIFSRGYRQLCLREGRDNNFSGGRKKGQKFVWGRDKYVVIDD